MIRSIITYFPGRLGIFLRRTYLKKVLRKVGSNFVVSEGTIFDGRKIEIGDNVYIGRFCCISSGVIVGNNVGINCNTSIEASKDSWITIGNDVLIARNVVIRANDHEYSRTDVPINQQGHTGGNVHIGDDVWIGSNVVITRDVTIGSHSIVAAGSVVTNDVEQYSIVAGVPARLIKKRK